MDGTSAMSGDSLLAQQRRERKPHIVLRNTILGQKIAVYGNRVSASTWLPRSKGSKVSGLGTVMFHNSSLLNTTATFLVSTSYTLRFTVSDGTLSTSDDVITRVPVPRACDGTVSRILAMEANVSDDK